MRPHVRGSGSSVDRERLLHIYSAALDRGDLDAMAAVLKQAERDPVLEQSIHELDLLAEAEAPRSERESSPRPARLPAPPSSPVGMDRIIGDDPAIIALRESIERAASPSTTVLVRGEAGTGKKLASRVIHEVSERRGGPFVLVDCATLFELPFEREMTHWQEDVVLGNTSPSEGRHALRRGEGFIEGARGGTLVFDNIGAIPPELQRRLYGFLHEKDYYGIDCRVICTARQGSRAKRKDSGLSAAIQEKLDGIVLDVPPLRERPGDLALLADAVLKDIAAARSRTAKRLTPAALACLARHDWPGNVRELIQVLHIVAMLVQKNLLDVDDVASTLDGLRTFPETPEYELVPESLESGDVIDPQVPGWDGKISRMHLRMTLARYGGDVRAAARRLGLHEGQVLAVARSYGIKVRRSGP